MHELYKICTLYILRGGLGRLRLRRAATPRVSSPQLSAQALTRDTALPVGKCSILYFDI